MANITPGPTAQIPTPGTHDPGPGPTGGNPDWIIFGGALAVSGIVVTILASTAGDTAAYLFALLIILGFAGFGGRAQNVISFFKSIGIVAGS